MCVCVCGCVSHHMWLLAWLALRAGLAAVTGLVEEFVLSTAGIFRTSKHTTHLGGTDTERGIQKVRLFH